MATTKHTHAVIFGRRVQGCPRCAELSAGARPVQWHGSRRQEAERAFSRSCALHFAPGGPHALGLCGPVCTFGES